MNSTELNINLKALKKLDPYILSIEATSAQVALYEYSEKKGDWEKMEIEGTLFVYQREADPQYGFTVMNRLNIKNMVQPLTRDLEFQLQSPFLMYRNTSNAAIFSLWFFDQNESETITELLEKKVKVEKNKEPMKKNQQQGNGKGDLKQLLQSAGSARTQENSAPSSRSNNQVKSTPASETNDTGRNLLRLLSQNTDNAGAVMEGITMNNGAAVTNGAQSEKPSSSVQDFFAKAVVSTEAGNSAFTSVPPCAPGPMFPQSQPPVTIQALPIAQGLAQGMVPVGGFHQVRPDFLGSGPPMPGPEAGSGPGINPIVQKLMSNPGIHSVDAIEAEQRQSASPPNPETKVTMTPNTKKLADLESDLKKKLHIGGGLDNNNDHTFAPVQQADSAPGPHVQLLSPRAFSASPSNDLTLRGESPPLSQITPLTQGQLVEAMNFLLESDAEFVTKIHQAYVMSLNRKLSAK